MSLGRAEGSLRSRTAGRHRVGGRPLAQRYDAVVIGGGHNGLISAAYLARAGLSTLVLERRHILGGAAVTEEVFPGLPVQRALVRRQPAAAGDHPRPGAARSTVSTSCRSTAPSRRSRATTSGAPTTTARRCASCVAGRRRRRSLRGIRPADGEMARFIKPILAIDPARPDRPGPARRCCRSAASCGRSGRCRERQQLIFIQLMTMSAADFLDQWFETDPLKATMSRPRASSAPTWGCIRPGRPTSCCTTTWVRSTAPSGPGASRRAAPAASATRSPARPARTGAEIRTEAPVATDPVRGRPCQRRGARKRRGDPRGRGAVAARRPADVPRAASNRARSTPSSRRRSVVSGSVAHRARSTWRSFPSGSSPTVDRILTTRDCYPPKVFPESITVVGTGVTGVEFVHMFSSFGADVTLVVSRRQVLPGKDPEVAAVLEDEFTRRGSSCSWAHGRSAWTAATTGPA